MRLGGLGGLLLLAASVTVPLESGQCPLELAVVEHVSPDAARVLAVYRCGGFPCWEVWMQIEGRVSQQGRACLRDTQVIPVPPGSYP